VTCAAIAIVVFWAPGPDRSLRSSIALHDLGHLFAFGLVTALCAFAAPVRNHQGARRWWLTAGIAAGAAVGLGAAVEVAQALSGGNGDAADVLRDAGGALFAALVVVARDPALSARARAVLGVVASLVLVPFTLPTLAALTDEAHARAQFPVLAGFERAGELSRFDFAAEEHARLTSTLDEQGRAVRALRLLLPRGKYPGFGLRYFPRDWHSLRALQLLLVNPEPVPFEMTIRIDDAEYDSKLGLEDRYNRSFLLSPGANRIEIPLADIAAAPRSRPFDLARVTLLLVYAIDLARPRELIVGPIMLVR
jgi:hypothetical protein